jgi:hypothetical protein
MGVIGIWVEVLPLSNCVNPSQCQRTKIPRQFQLCQRFPRVSPGSSTLPGRPVAWNYDDDVYVVYEHGDYHMYNSRHPGITVTLRVF